MAERISNIFALARQSGTEKPEQQPEAERITPAFHANLRRCEMKKNKKERGLTNWTRIFHPDVYCDNLAMCVLRGTLGIRDIPFQARVSRKSFYVYAFRLARGERNLRIYDDALSCLREDLNLKLTDDSRWMLTYLYQTYRDGRMHLATDIYYLQRAQENLRHTGRPH